MVIPIHALDHLVLTVRNRDAALHFYTEVLGMQAASFGEGRTALHFGNQKINLHIAGQEIAPHAAQATPGSADLCLLTALPIAQVQQQLAAAGVAIELGPVQRTGAMGTLLSVYVRDPDANLIEIANMPAGGVD